MLAEQPGHVLRDMHTRSHGGDGVYRGNAGKVHHHAEPDDADRAREAALVSSRMNFNDRTGRADEEFKVRDAGRADRRRATVDVED